MLEETIALAVLACAGLPAARFATAPRVARAVPQLALAVGLALAVYGAAVGAVAVLAPAGLGPLALAAASLAPVALVRLRPGHGSRRRLPPGSLAPLRPGHWSDHRFYERQAAAHGPVFKTRAVLRPAVCVVGLDRAARLLREHEGSLHTPAAPFHRLVPGGFIRYLPPDAHAALRRRLAASFREGAGDAEPVFRRVVEERLGSLAPGEHDPRPLLGEIAWSALAAFLLGVRPDEPAADTLRGHCARIDTAGRLWCTRRSRRAVAAAERLLAGRTAALPHAGAEPSVLADLVRADPLAARDPALLRNLVLILCIGSRDLTGLLHWLVQLLAENPAWAARVRSGDEPGDLAARVVAEAARLEQSEYLVRATERAIEVDGFHVPRGWLVRIGIRESHRDPALFAGPDAFDPDRFLAAPGRLAYAPFGLSPRHSCLGERAALAIARLVVEELCRRFEPGTATPGARVYRDWHWRPAGTIRLAAPAAPG